MRLSEIATRLGGTISGGPDPEITGVGEIEGAGPGMIVYAADARALAAAEAGEASALLLPGELEPRQKPAIRVSDGRLGFARLLALFAPPSGHAPGIHPTALLGSGATLGSAVHLGPYVVLGDGVRVGARTAILAGTVIGDEAVIGEECTIHSHVTVAARCVVGDRVILHPGVVVGSDGFGYAAGERGPEKIPHLGRVVIEDDVEIGANTTIDRATLGETRIGGHTKIDNLVQIAHNVRIGRGALIAGQVGIAGSAALGDGAILAGQVGVKDHVHIGERVTVLGQAGVTKDVPAGQMVSGTPAAPHREALLMNALLRRLPELFRAVEALRQRMEERAGTRGSGGPEQP